MANPTGLTHDPRIHVDAAQLRQLGAQARKLSLLPRQPARSVLNGRHASRLRGRGLNFEELRDYQPGDDIRTIDWKVTARTGTPHVRVYTEERDRPALLLVDQRLTMFFGTKVYMKSVIAAQAAAIAAHRVLAQGDRVGGIVFGDDMVAEHRPQRRPAALHRLLSSITQANQRLRADLRPQHQLTLNTILQSAQRIARTNALVLVFSDFAGLDDSSESQVRALAASNDLLLFHVADPTGLGDMPRMKLTISDGHQQARIDTSDEAVRKRVAEASRSRLDQLYEWSNRYGFPVLPLSTETPALDQLMRLLGHAGGRL